jgi:Wnt-binding factor required for Wnt secretion
VLHFSEVSKYHRFMLIQAKIIHRADIVLKPDFEFELLFERNFNSEASGLMPLQHPELNAKFKCSDGKQQECEAVQMLYVPQLGLETTSLQVEFILKNSTTNTEFPFEGVQFMSTTGNPEFVQLLTTTKYVLFCISLIAGIRFYRKLKAVPAHMRVVEQKLLLRQSILLVLYNDPFYAMIFYSPNQFQYTNVEAV